MGAVLNGLALCKLRAFGSGFLIFSDYMRAPIRLSAIMELPVVYVFTHDSIGVGEDGPTHQPIEQLASLRSIPGLVTIRPGDANEAAEAWRWIMEQKHTPAALILSRQNLPTLDRKVFAPASGLRKGAYTLCDAPNGKPDVILIGTGSEVSLVVSARELLAKENIQARVVSMPSWELFEAQPDAYKESVLPDAIRARVTVEQASRFGWERYAGRTGAMVGMLGFGASAPLKDLQKKFGFLPERIAEAAKEQCKRFAK
jgi:transketolase